MGAAVFECQVQGPQPGDALLFVPGKKHVTQEYIQIQSDSMEGLLYPQDSL